MYWNYTTYDSPTGFNGGWCNWPDTGDVCIFHYCALCGTKVVPLPQLSYFWDTGSPQTAAITGTVLRDFPHFWSKNLCLGPIWTGENGLANFLFLQRYSRKNVCPHSQHLRWYRVSVVNNYTDTMSAWSTTTLTPCHCSQRLRGHMSALSTTTQTLSENFEGLSQILKEQSGEKRLLDVCTNPMAII